MSNHLALAHGLLAVKWRLNQEKQVSELSTWNVDIGSPNSPTPPASTEPTIRLYAYQVVPNASLRNADLPSRTRSGQVLNRPAAALDMHFLMSFYGERGSLVPEQLLGFAHSVMQAYPVLDADALAGSLAEAGESDLELQRDRVTISPLSLSLEDLNRLWSTLTTEPYVLSTAWQASCFFLERPVAQRRALPVRSPAVTVQSLGGPFLTAVVNADDAAAAITYTDTIELTGTGLRGETTQIQIGSTTFDLSSSDTVRATSILIDLTTHDGVGEAAEFNASLTPGVHPIRVVHPVFRSNALQLVITPVIVGDPSETETPVPETDPPETTFTIGVTIQPGVVARQRATLHLSRYTGGRQLNYSVAEERNASRAGTSLSFEIPNDMLVAMRDEAGTGVEWIVRVEIDGVSTIPTYDEEAGAYAGPVVTI